VARRISRTVFSALRLFVIIVSSSGYDELKLSLRQSGQIVQLELTGYNAEYQWIVPNDADTNQSDNTECAYDRIVITEETNSNYAGNWGIVNISSPSVSDHHAVWAEFFTQ